MPLERAGLAVASTTCQRIARGIKMGMSMNTAIRGFERLEVKLKSELFNRRDSKYKFLLHLLKVQFKVWLKGELSSNSSINSLNSINELEH